MPTAMVISPHADDAAAFCGGKIIKLSDAGWQIVLVRVTDDARDSVGLTIEDTIARNTQELQEAANIMGITEIIELGFPTDSLADIQETVLRERLVYYFRKYKPFAVFTFDPFSPFEGNLDHVRVAQATEEAFWVSCFDLHHPEHFDEGLEPFAVCEKWYFGRPVSNPNHCEDITDVFERRIAALAAHRTMMRNTINQLQLQLKTFGRHSYVLESAMEGDLIPLVTAVIYSQATEIATNYGLGEGRLGEEYRFVRFGDMEELIEGMSEPID